MKKYIFLSLIAALSLTACKSKKKRIEENAQLPKTSMQFDSSTYNFGTITQGDVIEKVVYFTNTGNNPLVIAAAQGSCGCTIPEYSKDPVAPGKKGELKIKFNSEGKQGNVNKSVMITANTTPPVNVISFNVQVNVPEEKKK